MASQANFDDDDSAEAGVTDSPKKGYELIENKFRCTKKN